MDHMSGNKEVINWNDTESILNILKKIRGKMAENRRFNLFILISVDIKQILKRDTDDALSSYHPVLKNDTIDEYIVKLNKNTIRDLMGKNEEFKQKIMGKLSKILLLNLF